MLLVNDDCEHYLHACNKYFGGIFLDPPDNMDRDYQGYTDKRSDYYDWLDRIIGLAIQKADVVWLSYWYKHDFELKYRLHRYSDLEKRTFIWRYTFGQHNSHDCGNGYRPILRISKPDWTPNVDDIRVMSKRQILGDARANPVGRVPDDVWDFPRIVGNANQRREWHPTQHPEELLMRIMQMSGDGDFLDCFAGTGTVFRAAVRIEKLNVIGVEISEYYCSKIKEEFNAVCN